jgi:asparagine synthase (glutamine-hydrolysing)
MLAAESVAASLQLPFHQQDEEPDSAVYVQLAERTARCEALSAGFGLLDLWVAGSALSSLAPRFWSGLMLDDLLGGYGFHLAHDPKHSRGTFRGFMPKRSASNRPQQERGEWSFERFCERLTSWGMLPEQLSELLRPPHGPELAVEAFFDFRRIFEESPGTLWQQAFRTKLATRCRFHLGAGLWRMSFGSWPISPFLDRRLLELAIDLPPSFVLKRRMEQGLLSRHFPELAQIPLDDGSLRFRAVNRSIARRVAHALVRVVPARVRDRLRWGRIERRRYRRHFDLDQAHWKAIRHSAEPYRRRLATWLNPPAVDRILPRPDAHIGLRDPCGPGASYRSLLGLMLFTKTCSPC